MIFIALKRRVWEHRKNTNDIHSLKHSAREHSQKYNDIHRLENTRFGPGTRNTNDIHSLLNIGLATTLGNGNENCTGVRPGTRNTNDIHGK